MKYLLLVLKVVLALFILLFALATWMGGAYLQTVSLVLLVGILFYWPEKFPFLQSARESTIVKVLTVFLLFLAQFTVFTPQPKKSIYLSEQHREELLKIYDEKLKDWPDETEHIYVATKFGKVHVLACGENNLPPLILLHAAAMGAHSWAENLEPLLGRYRVYAIDNIGEGGYSQLNEALVYPNDGKELADLYAAIADSLGIVQSLVFGASNGGFIAQNYAYYYPEKVDALVLFGPMGLTPLSNKSILMLSVATMYPFQFVRDRVIHWALGDDAYCNQKYGGWFNSIIKSTIPSVAKPEPMTVEQKQKMHLPVLVFLGMRDPIVGDAETAKRAAEAYPNCTITILDSGHLVSIEQRTFVNAAIQEFLQSNHDQI